MNEINYVSAPTININYNPLDIEKGLIGAVLADATHLNAIAGRIQEKHFQIRTMRQIWSCVLAMHSARETVDLLTVTEKLGVDGVRALGGHQVLIDAFDTVATTENVEEYAKILEGRWRVRELSRLLAETKKILDSEGYDVAFDQAQAGLIGLSQYGDKAGFTHISDLVADWFESVEEMQNNPELRERHYLPTGFLDYDKNYGGLPNGLNILAGRPAQGKTSLAVNMAVNVARQGKSVLFFSLEMSQAQLVTRILSSMSKIDSRRLEQGDLAEFEMPLALDAAGMASGLDIYLDEQCTELSQIIGQIEQWRLQHGRSPDLVVVDYLGLVKVAGVRGENVERQSAGRVANELAVYFTKKLRAPLLMLCQLNRGVEGRQNKRPLLSDLRDSGEIEQAAARVDMVYRDAYYNPRTEDQNIGEIITTKNRFGTTGTVKLFFESETTTFHNLAKGEG